MLFYKKNEPYYYIGIWKIEEDLQTLISDLSQILGNDEVKYYLTECSKFKYNKRKLEWLSARRLLCHLLQNKKKEIPEFRIIYNSQGKPSLNYKNTTEKISEISISHSGNYVAVILSDKYSVGIDIELMSDRINRISHKFVSEQEQQAIIGKQRYSLYQYWCAKETLFKIYGKGNLDFKKNIKIKLTNINDTEEQFTGTIETNDFNKKYVLHHFSFDDYIVVFTAAVR